MTSVSTDARTRSWRGLVLAVSLACTLLLIGLSADGTRAAWSDQAAAQDGSFTVDTVPLPPTLNCTAGLLNQIRFSWTATSTPMRIVFTVGTASAAVDIPAGQSTYTLNSGLLGTGSGTAYLQRVAVYPATTWYSAPGNTRSIAILLGLASTCT